MPAGADDEHRAVAQGRVRRQRMAVPRQALRARHQEHQHLAAALEQRPGGAAGERPLPLLRPRAAQRLAGRGGGVAPERAVAVDLRRRERGAGGEQVGRHVRRARHRAVAAERAARHAEVGVERDPPRHGDDRRPALSELLLRQARRLDHRGADLLAVAPGEHGRDAGVGERHHVRASAAQVPGHRAGIRDQDRLEPARAEDGLDARPLDGALLERRGGFGHRGIMPGALATGPSPGGSARRALG